MTKMQNNVSKVIIRVGLAMAKVSTNTACPWINYQPKEPEVLTGMRRGNIKGEKNR